MSMITKKYRRTPDDYLELVRRFPLRPIRSRDEYTEATAILVDLIGRADAGLSAGQSDYTDVLGRLVREYDQQHSHFLKENDVTPLEALKHLMEEHGMNTVALGKLVGGTGQASLILNGKRELSKSNIRTLAAHFNVSTALFI
ncbi:MAG: transcriptional regulator [Phycisphaerales bacterium]|jgi:HTH-type transcriptional regulator/antitoxin HigA|nr:transcriptional regulator [Phycisphaerales bacterium]